MKDNIKRYDVPINKLPADRKMEAMSEAIKKVQRIAPSSESIALGNAILGIRGTR